MNLFEKTIFLRRESVDLSEADNNTTPYQSISHDALLNDMRRCLIQQEDEMSHAAGGM